MIYPDNFEKKIGFSDIRQILAENTICQLGREMVEKMAFSDDVKAIALALEQVREFRRMTVEHDDFPLNFFFDMREQVMRLRLEGTYMEEEELWNLKRSLETIHKIITYLCKEGPTPTLPLRGGREIEDAYDTSFEVTFQYPALQQLTEGVRIFPNIVNRIAQTLDQYGRIKDNASKELAQIRYELKKVEGSISHTLNSILRAAQQDGLVDKDVAPTLRDGRLVIPVAPAMKRKVSGIVHDESATGKTVFIEPTEVVEANNRVRELEADERREVIRILKDIALMIHPFVRDICLSYRLLADIDFIRAKALLADKFNAYEPEVMPHPIIDFVQARHPLLEMAIGEKIVPLDIMLTPEKRLLVISGPNAGGKSVCLKTTGLLQYMLQCGLSIPVSDRSKAGIFKSIMIDIGDEQSLSDDLSTYSGHLNNMKQMIRNAQEDTLILIDEFGTGTEPGIGGAIAEAVLGKFWEHKTFGVITTHYQNLKHFADDHEGVVNGAMLYDRHEMRALFQLQIGRPGSSFAIEIARKIGLPEDVIAQASEIVGQDYIQSDKYLQDIVRDKRYWETKRQQVHQREKDIEKTITRYETGLTEVEQERKAILRRAKEQAEELIRETNRKIENTIREIREAQAEKEATRKIREDLRLFEEDVRDVDQTANDEAIARKIAQIQARKERHEKRRQQKAEEKQRKMNGEANSSSTNIFNPQPSATSSTATLKKGDYVKIRGTKSTGQIESISGKSATIIFGGGIRTTMKMDKLEASKAPVVENVKAASSYMAAERGTRETIDNRREHFHQDLDVRGMRGDEALNTVQYYIDDAILVGVPQVRILHGKGNGILRQLIRQYLSGIPNVRSYRDEHVQFGGAGITVVELG